MFPPQTENLCLSLEINKEVKRQWVFCNNRGGSQTWQWLWMKNALFSPFTPFRSALLFDKEDDRGSDLFVCLMCNSCLFLLHSATQKGTFFLPTPHIRHVGTSLRALNISVEGNIVSVILMLNSGLNNSRPH